MNLQTAREWYSKTAYRVIDGEPALVGKFGRITQLDNGDFDVWFVGPDLSPLGSRKLTVIAQNLPLDWQLIRLTGEGIVQGRGAAFLHEAASLCGVRKKRRVSQKERDRLARMRDKS